MTLKKEMLQSIDDQFAVNKKKNLFYEKLLCNEHFLPETKVFIQKNKDKLLQIDKSKQGKEWIDAMTDKAVRVFCASNQFIDLRESHIAELRAIYTSLWDGIITELNKDSIDFDWLQKSHIHRLSSWLEKTNSFTKELNSKHNPEIINVVCAEYSSSLQLQLLQIDLSNIQEPILDIGCGEHAHLVEYLRASGLEVYGMDRLCDNTKSHLYTSNWFEFTFQPNQWGTIISNLSFALHFTNNHLRKDGDYESYARKYIEILNSLKIGGTFYYAPSLPFIEEYLPSEKYTLSKQQINNEFSSTKIIRTK